MNSALPSVDDSATAPADALAQAFGSNIGQIWKSFTQLSLPLPALVQMQSDYVQQATALWNGTLQHLNGAVAAGAEKPLPASPLTDRRFAASEWSASPVAAYVAQLYLLNSRTLTQLAEQVKGDEKTRQRLRFAVQQWVDAAAPSNCLALNPEAQRKALETRGESIAQGLRLLWNDLQRGHVSQTDESVFEVGRNVATTAGSVVYENHLFQLIEYHPLTPQVFERPILFVPPCINKYYILDLKPENSLIRYTVEQGHRVFVISWRNGDDSIARCTWDDYVEDAVIRALHEVQAISGAATVNALGFCVGGTLLANALAVLAARGEKPVASLTLLTTFLDFSHTGVLDLFIDEASVQLREMAIGADSPNGGALLKGQELASTFSLLRPNDLVWGYVVGNYLKGEAPPPFDLLFWNSDTTHLPGPMYCWYLRNTYLENNLMVSGKLTVCGEKVDLSRIDVPAYVYGSRDDHIVPWESAWRSTQLLGSRSSANKPRKRGASPSSPPRFVLGASGHIAGVINPPAKNRRSHWTLADSAPPPAEASAWLAQAVEHPGSWWPDWAAWLAPHGSAQVAAPATPGDAAHPVIEPAPGRYVRQKA